MKNRQQQTLKQLALKGPMNTYQIWKSVLKQDRGPKSAYRKTVNSLLKKGLLVIKESKSWYGKRTENIYGLTLQGLFKVLKIEAMWQRIDEVVAANKELVPVFFELWPEFERFKVKDIAVKLLRDAVNKLRDQGIPSFPEKIEGRRPTLGDWLPRLAVYPYDAMLEGTLSREEAKRWHRILLEPKVERLYVDTLKWMVDSHRSAMEAFSEALEKHHELKRAGRVVEIIEKIQDPVEQLKALKKDKDLWQTVLRLYPEAKDEKNLLEILEKIKTGKLKAHVAA